MVVFVDLDDNEELDRPATSASLEAPAFYSSYAHFNNNFGPVVGEPRFYSRVTEAFGCYPIVIVIASLLDLNSLDSLALACRQIRVSLLQYRNVLLNASLRCSNDLLPVNPQKTFLLRARARDYWVPEEAQSRHGLPLSKPSSCARDLVGPCRKCGTVVCRNCAIKPPSHSSLGERHRRLCPACVRAPLATLVKPPLAPNTSPGSEAVRRAVCQCESEGVFLCLPCGRSIKAADHDYFRTWRWRIQYGEVLGGLGTGIGDGDRGVICGREQDCCLAREQEQEMDSVAEDSRTPTISGAGTDMLSVSFNDGHHSNGPNGSMGGSTSASPGPSATDPGYERHEIQGIGGILKKKLSRMVRVGACVPEWEDERARRAPVLEREVSGAVRSWCGWCNRPIPAQKEETPRTFVLPSR